MKLSMQLEERTFLKRIDWNFALVILALNLVGLINLYSATHGMGTGTSGVNRLFLSQIFWLSVGWVVYFLMTFVDYQLFLRMAYVIYGLNAIALLAVIFMGKVALGAQRWLDLGFFMYQPSETMKVAMVLVLARVMARKSYPDGLNIKDMIVPGLIIGVPFIITAAQPDLGTALMLGVIGASILFFIRIRTKILVTVAMAIAIAMPIAWFFGMKDYQKNRVLTFVYPGRDPRGAGYNSIQSRIAVGSGKILGKGFRKGTQSQLEFLPERHTDFIFSVLSEEHGFIGSITTIGLFSVLFLLGTRIASQARDKSGAIMAVGILSILFWHMFINIGMVIGLLPIVGVPLPLLSYGGSSMLTTMAGLGLISSTSYRKFLF
jgi:rod shape determining protein RodA